MTLPQPSAFNALVQGVVGECPCCRRAGTPPVSDEYVAAQRSSFVNEYLQVALNASRLQIAQTGKHNVARWCSAIQCTHPRSRL